MAQPLNPQPDCLDFELLPATPLVPNAGSVRLYADATSGDLAAIKADGTNALPGGAPGGASGQFQFNNAGAFGGIAESSYDPAGPSIVIADPNLAFEILSGPAEQNGLIVSNAEVTVQAGESGSGLQFNADSDITIASFNGDFSLSSANGGIEVSNAGTVLLSSSATPPKYSILSLPMFASNAAAISGGLTSSDLYRTGADPDVVCVVH